MHGTLPQHVMVPVWQRVLKKCGYGSFAHTIPAVHRPRCYGTRGAMRLRKGQPANVLYVMHIAHKGVEYKKACCAGKEERTIMKGGVASHEMQRREQWKMVIETAVVVVFGAATKGAACI